MKRTRANLNPLKKYTILVAGRGINIGPAIKALAETGIFDEDRMQTYSIEDIAPRTSGTPAQRLQMIRNSDELMAKALGVGSWEFGVGSSESVSTTLVELGIMKPVVDKPGHYCFSEMMRYGLATNDERRTTNDEQDSNYTRTMINAICDIRYKFKGEGETKPMELPAIPDERLSAVRELVKMAVLHQINLEQKPGIDDGKVLWHIIEEDVVAPSQRSSFAQNVNSDLEKAGSRERICLWRAGKTLDEVTGGILKKCPNATFDVALASANNIEKKVPSDMKQLVFEGKAGDFVQLEGIVAALRALHGPRDDILPALRRIYSALNGSACPYDIDPDLLNNPQEFAKRFIFKLPPIAPIPDDEIRGVNRHLRELLVAA
jgi:hypothetical protein